MSGRGWFDGAMEVISGPSVGRSTTPTRTQRPAYSAPSSPVSSYPAVTRIPSQDTLDRSIHNNSGHGKSTAQIIKELRKSNSALTAKTAQMEFDFMNELNKVTTSYEEKNNKLEEEIAKLESESTGASKLKEENAFQRHTIADLKNQLYQLQNEMEEAECEKKEEHEITEEVASLRRQVADLTKKATENEHDISKSQQERREAGELTKELRNQIEDRDKTISSLREEVDTYSNKVVELETDITKVKAQNEENKGLQKQVEDLTDKLKDESRSEESSGGRVSELFSQLQESREACDTLEKKLSEAESANKLLVEDLRKELDELKADKSNMESRHKEQMAALEKERDEARRELETRPAKQEKDVRAEEKLRDVVAKAAKERADLESDFKTKMDSLEVSKRNMESQYQKRLASLEKERDDARQELEKRTADKERADLESEYQAKIEALERAKREEIEALEKRLKEVESKAQHGTESEEVQQLKKSLEETQNELIAAKAHWAEMEESRAKVEKLEETARSLEAKGSNPSKAIKKQLREAQIALVALDDEKKKQSGMYLEKITALEIEKSKLERSCRVRVSAKDATIAELKKSADNDSSQVTDLVMELSRLKGDLKDRQAELDESRSVATDVSGGSPRSREKTVTEQELREKLTDRDTTISTLVKASVTQEKKLSSLKSQVARLQAELKGRGHIEDEGDELMGPSKRSRSASQAVELDNLRKALDDCKEVADRLKREVSMLENELYMSQAEAKQLREHLDGEGSVGNAGVQLVALKKEKQALQFDHQEKLQERDAAIANLVKQTMSQEAEISSLHAKLEKMGGNAGPGWAELNRLQKESEIFAGQIIEQDEEMEALKGDLRDREAQIGSLTQELTALRNSKQNSSDEMRVADLQAELDELRESNETFRSELRDLRRELRDANAVADKYDDLRIELQQSNHALAEQKQKAGSSTQEDADLRKELEDAIASKEAMERRTEQQLESLRNLRNSAVDSLEAKLAEREKTIATMKEDYSNHEEKVQSLQFQVERMTMDLEDKASIAEDAQVSLQELRKLLDAKTTPEAVFEEKTALSNQVEDLERELRSLEGQKAEIAELKEKLAKAEEERDSFESSIVDSYERKMSLLKLNKDVTIDALRKELAEYKEKESDDHEDLLNTIKVLEMENKDIKDALEVELDLKNSKIAALEQTLAGQEQLVDHMRSEMDQLQSTMERANITRRAEIEEMQQEVMESSSKATEHEREVKALKMKLEEKELVHKAEKEKLVEKISVLEDETPLAKSVKKQTEQQYDNQLIQVRERLEKLQWRNTSLQEENMKLRDRLDKAEAESKAMKNDKYRTAALKEEMAFLMKRVKELEEDAKASPRPPPPPPPSVSKSTASSASKPPGSPKVEKRYRKAKSASPLRAPPSPGRIGGFLKRRSQSRERSSDVKQKLPPTVPKD